MNSRKRLFENFNLYAVTDIDKEVPEILTQIDRAYQGGVGIVQLRSKSLSDRELIRLGIKIREISRVYGKGFVVNDRPDIALAVNADAVHLGQEDMPIAYVKELLAKYGSSMCIGKSTHSLKQAVEAKEEGVDYIGVGPIFATPTKPDYPPVGLDLIRQVKMRAHIPFVAIGGIHERNLAEVIEAGAPCVGVVRAVFGSQDTFGAAKRLLEIYEKTISQHVG